MGTINLVLPTAGSTLNSIADPEIVTAFTTLQTWANGNVDGANVSAALTGRRLILTGYAAYLSGTTATTYLGSLDGHSQLQPTGNTNVIAAWSYLDPSNYAITGKSNTQCILRMSIASNADASSSNFTATMNPASFAGSVSGNVAVSIGSAVSGSSLTISSPSASAATVSETSAFTFPTAGAYMLSVVNSATIGAGNYTSICMQLFATNS